MVDAVKILGALLGGGNLSSGSGENILGSVLGAALSPGQGGGQGGSTAGGNLGDLLGGLLGGASAGGSGKSPPAGGLGDLLGSVLGGLQSGATGSGRGSVGAGNTIGATPGGGSLGDLLGGVAGANTRGGSGGSDLSDLIDAALKQFGNLESAAQQGAPKEKGIPRFEDFSHGITYEDANEQASVLIRAMVQAARSDGRVDKEEQQRILGRLGSVTREEVDFVNAELARPLDIRGFANDVPRGMENQVYTMSLMAIDLDSQGEARYLHQLGQALGINAETANRIHRQLGAPPLYT